MRTTVMQSIASSLETCRVERCIWGLLS